MFWFLRAFVRGAVFVVTFRWGCRDLLMDVLNADGGLAAGSAVLVNPCLFDAIVGGFGDLIVTVVGCWSLVSLFGGAWLSLLGFGFGSLPWPSFRFRSIAGFFPFAGFSTWEVFVLVRLGGCLGCMFVVAFALTLPQLWDRCSPAPAPSDGRWRGCPRVYTKNVFLDGARCSPALNCLFGGGSD